jgi:hypothetical protein
MSECVFVPSRCSNAPSSFWPMSSRKPGGDENKEHRNRELLSVINEYVDGLSFQARSGLCVVRKAYHRTRARRKISPTKGGVCIV